MVSVSVCRCLCVDQYHRTGVWLSIITPGCGSVSSLHVGGQCHRSRLGVTIITPCWGSVSSLQGAGQCHRSRLGVSIIAAGCGISIIAPGCGSVSSLQDEDLSNGMGLGLEWFSAQVLLQVGSSILYRGDQSEPLRAI